MPFLNALALGWRVMDLLDQRPAPAIDQGVVLLQVSLPGWESMPTPGLLVKHHPPPDLLPHLYRRPTTRTGNVHTTVSRACSSLSDVGQRTDVAEAPPMAREGSADAKRIKLDRDRDRGRRPPREGGNRMLAGAMKAANDK